MNNQQDLKEQNQIPELPQKSQSVSKCNELHQGAGAVASVESVTSVTITPYTCYTLPQPAENGQSGTTDPGMAHGQNSQPHSEYATHTAAASASKRVWQDIDKFREVYAQLRSVNGDVPPTVTALRAIMQHGSYSTISKYKLQLDKEYGSSKRPKNAAEDIRDRGITNMVKMLSAHMIDYKISEYEHKIDELKENLVTVTEERNRDLADLSNRCDELTKKITELSIQLNEKSQQILSLSDKNSSLENALAEADSERKQQMEDLKKYALFNSMLRLFEKDNFKLEIFMSRVKKLLEEQAPAKGKWSAEQKSHAGDKTGTEEEKSQTLAKIRQ